MENIKKKSKLKGCLKKSVIPLCLIAICVVLALINLVPVLSKMGTINSYTTLMKELSQSVSEKDVSKSPLNPNDRTSMEQKVENFVECKEEGKLLFNITGAIEYENIKRENINIKEGQTKLEFDKRELGAFVMSLIKAGWIEGFYEKEDAKDFINVVEIINLQTQDDITNIDVVVKVNFALFEENSVTAKDLKNIDQWLYITYNANFTKEKTESANMQINKLSKASNDLLLEMLFDPNKTGVVDEKVCSIFDELLKQLKKIETEWGFSYNFVQDKLVISV